MSIGVGPLMKKKAMAKVKTFWPEIGEEELWDRKKGKGFASLPRCLPLIVRILEGLDKGKSVGATYYTLWCRAWDVPIVDVINPKIFAYESGFNGKSIESTWRKRMRLLEKYGFIKSKTVAEEEFRWVLLMNPYLAAKKLMEEHPELVDRNEWETLLSRATEIGCTELEGISTPIQQ